MEIFFTLKPKVRRATVQKKLEAILPLDPLGSYRMPYFESRGVRSLVYQINNISLDEIKAKCSSLLGTDLDEIYGGFGIYVYTEGTQVEKERIKKEIAYYCSKHYMSILLCTPSHSELGYTCYKYLIDGLYASYLSTNHRVLDNLAAIDNVITINLY